jgi:hypothetical protein
MCSAAEQAGCIPALPTNPVAHRLFHATHMSVEMSNEWQDCGATSGLGLAATLKVEPRNRMAAAELQPLTRAADEKRAAAKEKVREREDRRRDRCAYLCLRSADASEWPLQLDDPCLDLICAHEKQTLPEADSLLCCMCVRVGFTGPNQVSECDDGASLVHSFADKHTSCVASSGTIVISKPPSWE